MTGERVNALDHADKLGAAPVKGLRIDPNGKLTAVNLDVAGNSCAEALRREIDCDVYTVVSLEPGLDMWLDDEGLLVANPQLNKGATYLAHRFGLEGEMYFGTAVLVAHDKSGNTTSLTDEQVQMCQEKVPFANYCASFWQT